MNHIGLSKDKAKSESKSAPEYYDDGFRMVSLIGFSLIILLLIIIRINMSLKTGDQEEDPEDIAEYSQMQLIKSRAGWAGF